MDWKNMTSTIDSSLVQCIGQDTVETILLELAVPDFTTFRSLSNSEFILKLNDYFLSGVRRLNVFSDMLREVSAGKTDGVKKLFCLTISPNLWTMPSLFPDGNGF